MKNLLTTSERKHSQIVWGCFIDIRQGIIIGSMEVNIDVETILQMPFLTRAETNIWL